MPGEVSESFDPEFGTGTNAGRVADAIRDIAVRLGHVLGERRNIVAVEDGPPGPRHELAFSERELRLVRFALARALETI